MSLSTLTRLGETSLAGLIASLPEEERWPELARIAGTDNPEAIRYAWKLWARPKQLLPESDRRVWFICTGRGWGKTRAAAECIRGIAEGGKHSRIALVARAAPDIRDVVVEGESGILAVSPPWFRPTYKPAVRRLVWPNGVMATTYSADEPDQLRGPQHAYAWADEVAAWRYPEAWSNLLLGLHCVAVAYEARTSAPQPDKDRPLLPPDCLDDLSPPRTAEVLLKRYPKGTAVLVYRDKGGNLRDWAVGADPKFDNDESLRAHFARLFPACELLDWAMK